VEEDKVVVDEGSFWMPASRGIEFIQGKMETVAMLLNDLKVEEDGK
jgi:hypothetical protein